jgi:hypothetical protein
LILDLKKKTSLRRRVSEFVLDRVRFYEGRDPYYFTPQALKILLMLRSSDPSELYRHAIVAAERARANGDSSRARACYTAAEKISRWGKNEMRVLSARTAIAETWVEEAERLDADRDSLAVRYAWKKAILAYRHLGNETKAMELRLRLINSKRVEHRTRSPKRRVPQDTN